MRSNTRIIVLRSKRIILCIGILIALLLIISIIISLFSSKKSADNSASAQKLYEADNDYVEIFDEYAKVDDDEEISDEYALIDNDEETSDEYALIVDTDTSQSIYTPGIYSSTLTLGNSEVELQITVDSDHINSITLTNLNESIETMYPLVKPALEDITKQILENQSIENVHYSNESRYTSMLLLQAISSTLEKAKK